jgi:hypothetical protein
MWRKTLERASWSDTPGAPFRIHGAGNLMFGPITDTMVTITDTNIIETVKANVSIVTIVWLDELFLGL